MTAFALTGATIWLEGLDLSSNDNEVAVNATTDVKDATTFASAGWREFAGGLKQVDMHHAGFASWAEPDNTLFGLLGGTNKVVSVSPTGADGAVAYAFQAAKINYTPLDAKIGELAAFAGDLRGSNGQGLVRGIVGLPKQSLSATANGTINQLGAVGTGQFIYGAVHLFSVGTAITVKVQSSSTIGFGSPTDRLTFSLTTPAQASWQRLAGAITDQYWRVVVSAITGTYSLAAVIAIAS